MKAKIRLTKFVAAAFLLGGLTASATDIFTFAGYTFDQGNTPDRATLLGNNVLLGGATFSSGFPTTATGPVDFPQGGTGFNDALTLGRLVGFSTVGVRGINLPNGNNGSSTRHGIEVFWSANLGAVNLPGPDFVIYETGSTSNTVEGVMARVRTNPSTDTWTDWFYFTPDNHQVLTAPEVAFSFGFDLSDMGVPGNAVIDRIQMANLTASDRIDTTNSVQISPGIFVGQGRVVFNTNASNVLPDAGSFDSDRRFDSATYDPDPLYVAVLHTTCEAVPPQLSLDRLGTNIVVSWPAPTCYTLQSLIQIGPINNWTNVPDTAVLANGRNEVTISRGDTARFFRLFKP